MSVWCPRPVAPKEPKSSTRIRSSLGHSATDWAKCRAALIGPTVCELEGPIPMVKSSKMLAGIVSIAVQDTRIERRMREMWPGIGEGGRRGVVDYILAMRSSALAVVTPLAAIATATATATASDEGRGVGSVEPAIAELRAVGAIVFSDSKSKVVTEVSANGNEEIRDSHLRLIARFTAATDVSLEKTRVGDAGVRQLKGLRKLEWLNLFQTQVGDAGLKELSEIDSLKLLPIGGTRVTNAGLEHAGEMEQLEYLGLRGNAIDDRGMVHLGGLANLKGLHLGETGVGDLGLKRIAALGKLEQLWLHDTAVSDASVELLSRFKKLRQLDVRRTNVSAEGARRLRMMLPRCNVKYEE